MSDTLKSMLDSLRTEMGNLRTQYLETFTENVKKLESQLTQTRERLIRKLSERISNLKRTGEEMAQNFSNRLEQTVQSFDELTNKIEEETLSSLLRLGEETKTSLNEMRTRLSQEAEKSSRELMTALEDLKKSSINEIRESSERIVGDIVGRIEQSTSRLRTVFESILSESMLKEIREMLNVFSEGQRAMQELYEETVRREAPFLAKVWVVKGLNGILAHIQDMISRAKSIVLIVTPSIEYVPVDQILKLGGFVRVQIAAGIELSRAIHVNVLEKLKSRDRTLIRHYKRGILLGAIVDDKEAIFATLPETVSNPEEIMGVATTSHEWVMAAHDFLSYAWTTAEDVR